jgi:hypothetical protein
MKLWGLLFLAFSISSASSNCNVYIPEKTFYHSSGYGINFDFTDQLALKGYLEVLDPLEANLILEIEGVEVKGRFHRAQAKIKMGKTSVIEHKICLTQMCSIYDYGKVFKKAYATFFKSLVDCI